MGLGTTLTLGIVNAEGSWEAISADNPIPVSGVTGGGGEPPAVAGLDTLGFVQGIFIENGGTLPPDLPEYVLVIEQE